MLHFFVLVGDFVLFLFAALLAGVLAMVMWTEDAAPLIAFPVVVFAFSAICIACCVRIRNLFLRVACLLGMGGASGILLFFLALAGAS
ncbi:MAG: hypothetical protein OXE43_14395 [Chloroflexi bacterium]|nr:hypothetical protein [Chloroflexota bacterium]